MECEASHEISILSKLQSSTELTGIHRLFTAHLHPFTPFLKPSTTAKKPLKSSKPKPPDDPATIRSLAKQFLSFLHKSLSLIPKRLSESPKIPQSSAIELFNVYRLCLECLDFIAPVLAGKPHTVEVQRIRYIHCLEHFELYSEAEAECFAVLESFNGIVNGGLKSKPRKLKARLVPELDEGSADKEVASLILEIVVTIAKCGSKKSNKAESDYWRLVYLANESEPWFKVLDRKDFEKFHGFLATSLHVTVLSLFADINIKCFDVDLIREFSLVTFKEYKKSSDEDQLYKFVLRICSSLFAQREKLSSDIIINVLKYIWDFMAAECKVGVEKTTTSFLEIAYYCANKCHGATVNLCVPAAEHLNGLADKFHTGSPVITSILTLYGTGLLAGPSHNLSESEKKCRNASLGSFLQHLLDRKESLQQAAVSHQKGISHASSYWKALNFFCQSLAEYIYSNRKELFSDTKNAFSCDDLSSILEMVHQFSDTYLQYLRYSETEGDRETCGDYHRVISSLVVVALMLSFRTNQKIKESTLLVKRVISTELIPAKKLKYLGVSLYNVAVILKRTKQLKEAINSLSLCCQASWNYLVYISEAYTDKSHVYHENTSEKAIVDFVKEASERTAFLLEFSQEGSCNVTDVIEESLKCWLDAENLIVTLQTPVSLVKEWVKMKYLLSRDAETEHCTTLYSFLPSSAGMSKRALGKLMEEELRCYKDKSHLNPRFCIRMQMKIIDVLIEEIYITKESDLKKSRILIEKGKVLRAYGLERLDECIQCLSDAVLTLKSLYGAKKGCSSRVHNFLIHAYIMRALCTQEAIPTSMVLSPKSDFLRDIHAAVKLYLDPDHGHADEHNEQSEDLLYLWYQVIDFLSLKGYLDIHPSLYDIVIKLFEQKNFTLIKTTSELWKNKRLTHGLCASPVSCTLAEKISEHQDQLCDSNEFWRTCMEELKPLVVGYHHSENEIKQAAADLISHVPLSSGSIFLSFHLYYDLSGRLMSRGSMIEALLYAKEAYRLCNILLKQKFEYSVEKVIEAFDENGQIIEKSYYGILTFKVKDLVVTIDYCGYEGYILTPWNVLSCYLESILRVGVIQEILGNGSEAEMLLHWGRSVSRFQELPLFETSFSSALGELYRKQKLWCVAEREFHSAKKTLTDNRDLISCGKCACMLEITINQQIGDWFLNSPCSYKKMLYTETLLNAKCMYKSALDKLNLAEWRMSNSASEEARVEQVRESSSSGCASNLTETKTSISSVKSEAKIEPKRSRRTKKEPRPATERQCIVGGQNRRITRSAYRALGETHEIAQGDRQIDPTAALAIEHLSISAAGPDYEVPRPKCSIADLQSDITSLCNKMKCWHCVYVEAVYHSNLNNFVHMNWELVHRKFSLRLLISIGKLSDMCGNHHEAQEILSQSISILFARNSFCSEYSSASTLVLIESIGKHLPGDVLAVERASVLYYICWFTLKAFPSQDTRKACCKLSCLGTKNVISLLKLAFILCREVPSLFQKTCRLLALVYILSTSVKSFSLSPSEEGSESQWACFFHQASLGPHLNQQIYSDMVHKTQSSIASDSEAFLLPDSISEMLGSLRLAPESYEDFEGFVVRFFQDLPATPVICISLVSGAVAGLLGELLHCLPTIRAWILLSHLSSDNQHVVLLPVFTTLEASDDDASSSSVIFNYKDSVKQWRCPWQASVIDDIAPVFRHVLEANYYSSSDNFLKYINDNASIWWTQRNRLDKCLSNFLQELEDLWLGTWKYLLLGLWPDCYLDSIQKNLFGDEERPLQHIVNKKCYIGLKSDASSKTSVELENTMQLLYKRMLQTSGDRVESVIKKPIILVLDFEVQMLPWESLPILRNQEVYRMPSVGSIFATIDRCCHNHEQVDMPIAAFPLIDPKDSYYLLNPDGDLNRTQAEFENWFKDQNIEGKTGTVPTVAELSLALKDHDLFIYFGHGSGTQYIPINEIQKLNNCAATMLLGCSSGALYLKGSYMPLGAPISYLFAGSPIIVANLWEVTDKDIDRFGKAMLNAWLTERESSSNECTQCDVRLNKGNSVKCKHRPRIGSFMAQARDACNLGYLIGAAPVCYGVPTGIIKRKNV